MGAPAFGGGLIAALGTSKLTLDGVTIRNALTPGLNAASNTAATPVTVTIKGGTVFDGVGSADNCAAAASIIVNKNVTLVIDGSQIKNAEGGGVCFRSVTGANVKTTVRNGTTFANDVSGLLSETGTTTTERPSRSTARRSPVT